MTGSSSVPLNDPDSFLTHVPGSFQIGTSRHCDGGGDRFCVVHETVMSRAWHRTRYSYTRSDELSEADLRAYLARVGVTDVDRLVEEARTIGRRG